MHMADALISLPTAAVFWTVSGSAAVYASSKLKKEFTEEKSIPLMGVMGAFVFALQMVNFAIPATGSSGHFAGGFLLALLLGSDAAFLVMSSVLLVQALFFADGGLLALGCNIFNMGFIPAYVIYPIFKNFIKGSKLFIFLGAFLSLLLGSIMVSIQTAVSGVSELPFSKMLYLMVGIHALIGIVEGLITTGSYSLIKSYGLNDMKDNRAAKPYVGITVISLIIASVVSLFASSKPDGLEWSIYNILGQEAEPGSIVGKYHNLAAFLQEKISFLPDYNFDGSDSIIGTSVSGIVGAFLTILIAISIGYFVNKRNKS